MSDLSDKIYNLLLKENINKEEMVITLENITD